MDVVQVGVGFNLTVRITDAIGVTDPEYTGTVTFISSDTDAVLPGDSTLTTGRGVFTSVTLNTAGTQTITSTDTVDSSLSDTLELNAAVPLVVDHFLMVLTTLATAGVTYSMTVTAKDAFNTTVTTYAGSVGFTSIAPSLAVDYNQGPHTLTSGVGIFDVVFFLDDVNYAFLHYTPPIVIVGTDADDDGITGETDGTHVVHNVVASLGYNYFTLNVFAGTGFPFLIYAYDNWGNVVSDYAGTVHFTSSDTRAVLPANSTLTLGTGIFTATLKTIGTATVTATDIVTASLTATVQFPYTVSVGPTHHFSVTQSGGSMFTTGNVLTISVSALDAGNNPVTAYSGTVYFAFGTQPEASTPSPAAMVSGNGTFSVTLTIAGTHGVTATDTVSSTVTGVSSTVTVIPGPVTHFSVTAPDTPSVTPYAFSGTITALDAYNNTATAYAGTVHFTSTDTAAVLPANHTLTSGVYVYTATLVTVGTKTITVTDVATSSLTGTSTGVEILPVPPGPAIQLVYDSGTDFNPVEGSGDFNVTVNATNIDDDIDPDYEETVHWSELTGSVVDFGVTLPSNAAMSAGTITGTVNINGTAGNFVGIMVEEVPGDPYDTFTDTVGVALTAHTMNAGTGWVNANGDWEIGSSTFAVVLTGDVPILDATVTTVCSADGCVCVSLDDTTGGAGLALRVSDSANFWAAYWAGNYLRIKQFVAGVSTERAAESLPSLTGPHRLMALMVGNLIKVVLYSLTDYTITATASYASATMNNTETHHGLYATQDTDTSHWSNFSFKQTLPVFATFTVTAP